MTGFIYQAASQSGAWQRYLDTEHAARDGYLAIVARAHQEYLTGPFPDRESYNAVERTAWTNYYQAGRAAWQAYRNEMNTPPTPPAPAAPPPNPYPISDESYLSMAYPLDRPTFTEHPERSQ